MTQMIRRTTPHPGTCYELEICPAIPARIARLGELANDLYYSWSSEVRQLYASLDRELWNRCGNNPKLFLRRIAQERLDEAARDPIYLQRYSSAMSAYDTYHQEQEPGSADEWLRPGRDLVAYFCAEFGFHESLPIYSGGLGILAGDHCKAASDLRLPFVAVGLLYRQGYFSQTIDGFGNQVATFVASDFSQLPLAPALDAEGRPLDVRVELDGRAVVVKVWRAKAGRVTLYLLDTDVALNEPADRGITQQLYHGDQHVRLRQELVLGIGGVRALRALGLQPTVWHINEGHPAFAILERCREEVARGLEFETALELVAANTVFTTHTPVPAGHDVFDHALVRQHLAGLVAELRVPVETVLDCGASPGSQGGFNMTALAVRGSRCHNGVSRIHGQVASSMLAYAWPQVPYEENPIGYVTNGVHVFTFLAREWRALFDMTFGNDWRRELTNETYWEGVATIPDYQYWSTHQAAKCELLRELHRRTRTQARRNGCSDVEIGRITRQLAPEHADLLIVGFARRFATYKRATLLFADRKRLVRILSQADRPMLLVFAGKAHPNDLAGQQLIQTIHQLSRQPEFEGRLLLLESYDMGLARRLLAGVDVWLNTPEYPMEACGTSGQKAGLNGALNLSVLDGWWAEGFNGENGWGIPPHHTSHADAADRERIENQVLLDMLEHEITPLFFTRNGQGYPQEWVRRSKAAMRSILPRFNAQRMVMDYARDYYAPAQLHWRRLGAEGGRAAGWLAAWKRRVAAGWPAVQARRLGGHVGQITADAPIDIRMAVHLGPLDIRDVRVECLFGRPQEGVGFAIQQILTLEPQGLNERGEAIFILRATPEFSGLQYYKLRVHPQHPLLRHPLESGLMLWI
jgi:starch phosphorylase